MDYSYSHLDISFKNTTVFLIGSGTSIKTLHWNQIDWIRDRNVMVTNSNVKLFPNADALCWSDPQWEAENTFTFTTISYATSLINFTVCPESVYRPSLGMINPYYKVKVDSFNGLNETPYHVNGNNTGTRALNFLAHYRPKNIILLGFDLQGANWHNRYPATEDKYHDQFLQNFEEIAPKLKALDINVYNANTPKLSRLTCFEFTDIREWSDDWYDKEWTHG